MPERRGSAIQYLGAVVVLLAGLAVLAFGVRAVAVQAVGEAASARVALDRTAVTDAAATGSPAVTASAPPTATSSTSPTPSPAATGTSTVTFTVEAAPDGTRCWAEGCLLWVAKGDADCARASATLEVPADAGGSRAAKSYTQEVGGFVGDETRVVELDAVLGAGDDGVDAAHLTPTLSCLPAGQGY